MSRILCFVSDDFTDFQVALTLHLIKNIGKKDIKTIGYNYGCVVGKSGMRYKPDMKLLNTDEIRNIEGLIIPGGPIREQKTELTRLIRRLHAEKKLLAAICFGPQYLARAGVLDECRYTTSCTPEDIRGLGMLVTDPFPRRNYINQRIVIDNHIITAQGNAFVDFAFEISSYLGVFKDREGERNKQYADMMDKHAMGG